MKTLYDVIYIFIFFFLFFFFFFYILGTHVLWNNKLVKFTGDMKEIS